MDRPNRDGRDPNSLFSRVMNTPVAQNDNQVAVLVIFDRGVTKDAARKELDTLRGGRVAEVKEFESRDGIGPVIYLP